MKVTLFLFSDQCAGGWAVGLATDNVFNAPSTYFWFVFLSLVRQGGALVTLILQNSALALVMRFTRKQDEGQERRMYISTTAVVMAEILKFAVAFVMQYKVTGTVS